MMGPGYWFWLIPLASDSTSLGIVADAEMHPYSAVNRLEKAYEWLDRYEPQAAAALRPYGENVEDLLALQHFAHSCERVFSGDRWCLTGEAGVFTDPFYSPGSDFIAIGNTYICQLIADDHAGLPLAPRVRSYERLYQSFYDSMLQIFRNQYPLFGDVTVMAAKIIWDHAFYWGVLCQLVFQQRLADVALFADVAPELALAQELNQRMQACFRQWHETITPHNPPVIFDQAGAPGGLPDRTGPQ